jgi:hypothetical protein
MNRMLVPLVSIVVVFGAVMVIQRRRATQSTDVTGKPK